MIGAFDFALSERSTPAEVVTVLLYGAAGVMALGVADPEVEAELNKAPEGTYRRAANALTAVVESKSGPATSAAVREVLAEAQALAMDGWTPESESEEGVR